MSAQTQNNQVQTSTPETKPSDKELNFRILEQKYEKQLAQERERAARLEAEKKELEAKSRQNQTNDDDEDESDPYVDHKRLNKKLNKFGQNTQNDIQKAMQLAKEAAKEELKQEMWLERNPDFQNVMQNADKFYHHDPELAESLLKIPNEFERAKIVYKNIKALGLHKPPEKQSTIQDKIDANRKSPYYQPSGVSPSPYTQGGDFSSGGQENAYKKMQELKNRLRLG